MAQRSASQEVRVIAGIDGSESLHLFRGRGGVIPYQFASASIHVVEVGTLGPDLTRHSWLLVAAPPFTLDPNDPATYPTERETLAGELCIIELDPDGSVRRRQVLVRRVWHGVDGLFRLAHPAADVDPDDDGAAAFAVVSDSQVVTVLKVHGVLRAPDCAMGERGAMTYLAADHWLGVAGRIGAANAGEQVNFQLERQVTTWRFEPIQ